MKWKNAELEKPDADLIVLIHCPGYSESVWLGYFDDSLNVWFDESGSQINVAHWMELPEPPAASL